MELWWELKNGNELLRRVWVGKCIMNVSCCAVMLAKLETFFGSISNFMHTFSFLFTHIYVQNTYIISRGHSSMNFYMTNYTQTYFSRVSSYQLMLKLMILNSKLMLLSGQLRQLYICVLGPLQVFIINLATRSQNSNFLVVKQITKVAPNMRNVYFDHI